MVSTRCTDDICEKCFMQVCMEINVRIYTNVLSIQHSLRIELYAKDGHSQILDGKALRMSIVYSMCIILNKWGGCTGLQYTIAAIAIATL